MEWANSHATFECPLWVNFDRLELLFVTVYAALRPSTSIQLAVVFTNDDKRASLLSDAPT